MDEDGASLLLSVFDHDVRKSAGMCLVSCRLIPRLQSGSHAILNEGAPERKVLRLPLVHPSALSDSQVRVELEKRAGFNDSKAKHIQKLFK